MDAEDKGSGPSEEKTKTPVRISSIRKRRRNWPNTAAKWIKLLSIPLTIFVAAVTLFVSVFVSVSTFNEQQKGSAQMLATQDAASAMQSLDQQRQTTLETYIDRVSSRLPDLLKSKEGDDVRVTARTQTLTALLQLDPGRKRILLQFLYLAKLIDVVNKDVVNKHDIPIPDPRQKSAIVSLFSADLTNADLSGVDINGAFLREVHLERANLNGALLYNSNLYKASLSEAKLEEANLDSAYLDSADLRGADLTNAKMQPDDLYRANLSGANLVGANLSYANLRGADLRDANLSLTVSSYLDKTILKGAQYNTKEIPIRDLQGKIIDKLPPTQWPPGFDPKAAGATEVNTLP